MLPLATVKHRACSASAAESTLTHPTPHRCNEAATVSNCFREQSGGGGGGVGGVGGAGEEVFTESGDDDEVGAPLAAAADESLDRVAFPFRLPIFRSTLSSRERFVCVCAQHPGGVQHYRLVEKQ